MPPLSKIAEIPTLLPWRYNTLLELQKYHPSGIGYISGIAEMLSSWKIAEMPLF
jgi:hypothetical protein